MKQIDEIVAAYLQGDATPDEVKQLFDWIGFAPDNAKEFARATTLHTQLREQLSGERQARESGEFSVAAVGDATTEFRSSRLLNLRSITAVAALTISLFLGVGYWYWQGDRGDQQVVVRPPEAETFATIVQVTDAVWGESNNFHSGDRSAAAAFDLKSGFVRLQLDSGVEVTLEGPADFQLVSMRYAKFQSGLLTSTTPPGAEGVRIDTPSAQVVDLGTAFGIKIGSDGVSQVSVFDGEVEVGRTAADTKHLLSEGEAVRVDSGRAIESIPFDASIYQKIWPVSSGIASSSGAFRFAPPWPRRLRLVRSDDDIFVIPEDYAVTLDKPIDVNISTLGEYARVDQLTPDSIPAGEVVRSFILHYHPEQTRPARRAARIAGSIVFDRPVRGVILRHEELWASAGRFSPRNAGELRQRRQIELSGGPAGDKVTLSADLRTLTLNLASPNNTSDLLRVIVDASMPFPDDDSSQTDQ